MTDVADVAIRTARREEAEAIARVIRAAFATVAEKFGDIPPLHERADDILATMDAGDVVLAAVDGDDVVGTVRGETMADGAIMIRRLAVLPAYRRSGVARALMAELEHVYPDAERFELFTGNEAFEPLRLYESLGYRYIDRSDAKHPFLVFLEKCVR